MTKLILALDTNSYLHTQELIEATEDYVDVYKIGPQCYFAMGIAYGLLKPVFLDFKFHDIPSTVAKAVNSAVMIIKPYMMTVHAAGGEDMMRAAKEAAQNTKILAVTSLTSNKASIGYVYNLCSIANLAGVDGVICSAMESETIKVHYPHFITVVPGIRLPGDYINDQVRVSTPEQAKEKGADYIVVGRPITQSENPAATAKLIKEMIS